MIITGHTTMRTERLKNKLNKKRAGDKDRFKMIDDWSYRYNLELHKELFDYLMHLMKGHHTEISP